MIALALRNLVARPRRTFLTALAIIVGVAMVSGSLVLTDSMNKTVDQLFDSGQQGTDVVVSPKVRDAASDDGSSAPTIDAAVLRDVQAVPGVRLAVGDTFALVQMLKRDSDDPITFGPPSFIASLTPQVFNPFQLKEGRFPTAPDEVTLDKSTAERGGYELGDRLRVIGAAGLTQPKVVGIASYGDSSLGGAAVAIATPVAAQTISGHQGRYDSISVDAASGVDAKTLSKSIALQLKGEPVNVRTAKEQAAVQASDLKSALGFLRPVLLAFAGIALFVGSFVIVNSFSATLAQRSQELAVLRALGATRRQLQLSVQVEAAITGLVAGVIGLGAGLLVAPGILALFKGFGIDLPAQGTVIKPATIVIALVLGIGVTLIAAWRPVARATAVPPIQAMRGLDTSQREASGRPGRGAAAVTLLAVAAIVGSLLTGGTLAALLVAAGAALTFLAVALLAPIVLGPLMAVLGVVAARRGAAGRLAQLNAMREPRRTATTAGALMVGVALVSFVAIFAAGIGALVRDAFGERVQAQLALSDSGGQPFPAASQKLVRADPDVKVAVGIVYSSFGAPGGGDVTVAGVDPGLSSVYKFKWVDGNASVLDRMGPTDVLVDTKSDTAVVKSARVGDVLALKNTAGAPVTVTVRGRVEEGNGLLGGGLIGARTLLTKTPDDAKVFFSLVALKPGVDAEAAKTRLSALLHQQYPTLDALTRAELEDQWVGQVNQLVNMIYAFLAFALLVSLLGISTTFGLTVQERRRELGIMRAVGMTRRQMRAMIRWEAILTGLVGAILGVAIGLGFGALAAQLLADDGFSFVVPVGTLVVVFIAAGVVAALAAGRPARRAGKVNVVEVLTTE